MGDDIEDRGRENREGVLPSIFWFTPQMPVNAGAGSAKARNPEIHLDLLRRKWFHLLLPRVHMSRKLEVEESELQPGTPVWNPGVPRGSLKKRHQTHTPDPVS